MNQSEKLPTYKLKNADGLDNHVCKISLLRTLGSNEKNDHLITTVVKIPGPLNLKAQTGKGPQRPSLI